MTTDTLGPYERRTTGGSFYLRERATGRRSRLYTTLEAAHRAAECGELYTDAEYADLTRIDHTRRR